MRIKPLFGRADFEVGHRVFFGDPPERTRKGEVVAITGTFLAVRVETTREVTVISFLHVRAILN